MTVATTGTITMKGASGKEYGYSVYISDLAGVFWKWSALGAAVATSSDFILSPPENAQIMDISLLTTPTVSIASQLVASDIPKGIIVLVGNLLFSTQNRAFPHVTIGPGTKLQFMQM